MKIKVSEATNLQLNWMVAKCEGYECRFDDEVSGPWFVPQEGYLHNEKPLSAFTPTTDWSQGGPLLNEEGISRTTDHSGLWIAYWTDGYTEGNSGKLWMQCDKSELVAGLRCYVAKELGDEVEVPDDLA